MNELIKNLGFNSRKNVLLLGFLCALFTALNNALDNFTIHKIIISEDKISAAFTYLILISWTGTIVALMLSIMLGKIIDEDFKGIKINNWPMQRQAFFAGLMIAISSFFSMLGHQTADPSVIAALLNITIIYTLLYDVWKGQAKLKIFLLPVIITIIGGMMNAFNGSVKITFLGFFLVAILASIFRAFAEIIQQQGVKISDSVNFYTYNFFWVAFHGTILAFIVSIQRGYLSLLLETISRGILNLHWLILTGFVAFFAITLKLSLKKSQSVSAVLVTLSLNVVFSYPIVFAGNWFQEGIFGKLPSSPTIWIIRIIGSFLIILGVIKLKIRKQLITT